MTKPSPQLYDQVQINRMTEPLTIRVERAGNNPSSRTPIELPPREGMPPGQGWTKDDISRLEGWLVREWCGGGLYYISVIDALDAKHDWRCFFPTSEYPARPSPTMPSAAAAPKTPLAQAQALAQAQVSGDVTWPPVAPASALTTPAAPLAPSPAPSYDFAPTRFSTMTYPQMQFPSAPASSDTERRAAEEKIRLLEHRLASEERNRLDSQHKGDLERVRAESERQMEEMRRLVAVGKSEDSESKRLSSIEHVLAKLTETITARPAGPDPAMAAMEARMQAMLEAQQRDRDRDRDRERAGPDPAVAALEARMQAMMEAQQRDRERAEAQQQRDRERAEFEARLREQRESMERQLATLKERPTSPDPMMMMLLDVMKSNQQQAQMSAERAEARMLKPQDIIALTKESSNGLDDMKRSMTGLFTDVFSMQKQVVENFMQMQPQGESAAVRLIEAGLQKAGEAFERYGSLKTSEARSHAQAQGEVAKAQAEQMKLQQMHLQMLAQQEAGVRQQHGLNGAGPLESANHDALVNGHVGEGGANGHAPRIEVVDASTSPPPPIGKRTDEQWFGPALPHVHELRAGVTKYLTNIALKQPKLDPKTHEPIGVDAATAARAILQAADQISAADAKVFAFSSLFLEGRMEEFMEVLLPDAPYAYRADAAADVMAHFQAADDAAEGDDAGDDPEADREA